MKIFNKHVPIEGACYDGSVESIQVIRRVVSNVVGVDCVVIQHAKPDNAERIAVDNVVMMDFQKLFIKSPADGVLTEVHRGSWVVSFKDREGKPTQVLVFADNIFRANFETENDTDLSENLQT